jgi:hypothetical protein
VAPDVAAERGYRRYDAGDRATVLEVDNRLSRDEGWLRQAVAAPGWAMPKYAVMPDHPDFGWAPYAQLRPDWPVMQSWNGHDHGGMLHRHRDDEELQRRRRDNRGRCYCGLVHTSPPIRRSNWGAKPEPGEPFWDHYRRRREVQREWYQASIKDRSEHEAGTCEWARVPKEDERSVGVWLDGDLVRQPETGKILVRTGHLHPDTGECVVPTDKPHAHLDWAKYLYVKGAGRAQRIGTHPRILRSGFVAPEGLFLFVIEGTLKLDSIVSAGWPGIEAGSVTLWNAEVVDEIDLDDGYGSIEVRRTRELEEFARRHLEGVPTAVVCDSDWAENWMVREQVDQAVKLLADCGVPAVGCAPPPGEELHWNDPLTGFPKRKKHGVDDWLAKARDDGGDQHEAVLEMMVREDAHDDAPGLEKAVARMTADLTFRENSRTLLREFGRRATDSGVMAYKEHDIAASTGFNRSTVQRFRARLVERVESVRQIGDVEYHGRGGRVVAKPPRLLLPPDLLPPTRKTTLREWLSQA